MGYMKVIVTRANPLGRPGGAHPTRGQGTHSPRVSFPT